MLKKEKEKMKNTDSFSQTLYKHSSPSNQLKAISDVFTTKYARYDHKKKRRETWDEAVDRVRDNGAKMTLSMDLKQAQEDCQKASKAHQDAKAASETTGPAMSRAAEFGKRWHWYMLQQGTPIPMPRWTTKECNGVQVMVPAANVHQPARSGKARCAWCGGRIRFQDRRVGTPHPSYEASYKWHHVRCAMVKGVAADNLVPGDKVLISHPLTEDSEMAHGSACAYKLRQAREDERQQSLYNRVVFPSQHLTVKRIDENGHIELEKNVLFDDDGDVELVEFGDGWRFSPASLIKVNKLYPELDSLPKDKSMGWCHYKNKKECLVISTDKETKQPLEDQLKEVDRRYDAEISMIKRQSWSARRKRAKDPKRRNKVLREALMQWCVSEEARINSLEGWIKNPPDPSYDYHAEKREAELCLKEARAIEVDKLPHSSAKWYSVVLYSVTLLVLWNAAIVAIASYM